MAVQKKKSSRSKRGNRRSHDYLNLPMLSLNKDTGLYYIYHHISSDGFYRNKKIKR